MKDEIYYSTRKSVCDLVHGEIEEIKPMFTRLVLDTVIDSVWGPVWSEVHSACWTVTHFDKGENDYDL